jgi:hypothetical protein
LRKAHVDWTLVDIAERVGVTKQRIRQILLDAGLPTKAVRAKHYCSPCKKMVGGARKIHPECREKKLFTMAKCGWCGTEWKMLRSTMAARIRKDANKRFYHNRACFLAAHSGGDATAPSVRGAGGSGGTIRLVYTTKSGTGTFSVAGGAGGDGGAPFVGARVGTSGSTVQMDPTEQFQKSRCR